MNSICKFLLCLLFFLNFFSTLRAQKNNWMLGEWRGTGITPGSAYSTVFTSILTIYAERKNHFVGKIVQEVMTNKDIRIEKKISGVLVNDAMNIESTRISYVKQPSRGFWADCSSCDMVNSRITISADSIILTYVTTHCGRYCDGVTRYSKPLSGIDSSTQKKLVSLYGSADLIADFRSAVPVSSNKNYSLANGSSKTSSKKNIEPTQPVSSFQNEKNNVADSETVKSQLSRRTKTIATYNADSSEIKIELFDNGEIDGDMITVYHNKQKIIDRQVLGIKPITYIVKATAKDRVHEFTLVANNLGSIPPNTALMRITAGSKTYELFASTTLEDNVSIIIIYSGE